MVWWMHYSPSKRREGIHFGLPTEKDLVYETINIMYDLHDENYDGYIIHSLTSVGVNIFNIDMTKHDAHFFGKLKAAMEHSQNMSDIIPSTYYTPVGLSVTMSITNPIDVDERVDIIILRDVIKTDQLREFKKGNKKFASMPILFWPPTLKIEDLNELIKISDGIVLDSSLGNILYEFHDIIKKCKEARKPIFFLNLDMTEDYYKTTANDRQLLQQVHDIIEHRLDGILLADRGVKPPIELIQALIRATEVIEKDFHVAASDYLNLSFTIPVLQPYAAALAASLAALQSGASAIIVFTKTGASAKLLSCASPPCCILAVTRHKKTARRMHLYRKVMPLYYRERRACSWQDECLARVVFGTQFGLDAGLFQFGATLVVVAPSEEGQIYCNSFQISTVERIIQTYKCEKT